MRKVSDNNVYRIIDANFNRAKEGLRTCEDVCRFCWDDKLLTRNYKDVRHQLTKVIDVLKIKRVIESRNIGGDVGKGSSVSEFKRKNVKDIFYANSQRAKESVRVLEEFTKLLNKKAASDLKKLRYKLYAIEKKSSARC